MEDMSDVRLFEQFPEVSKSEEPVDCEGESDEDFTELSPDKNSDKKGRRKIKIQFLNDKNRRHITFSKRKSGILKKAYELACLTGAHVLLWISSETGQQYHYESPNFEHLSKDLKFRSMMDRAISRPDVPSANPSPPNTQALPPLMFNPGLHPVMSGPGSATRLFMPHSIAVPRTSRMHPYSRDTAAPPQPQPRPVLYRTTPSALGRHASLPDLHSAGASDAAAVPVYEVHRTASYAGFNPNANLVAPMAVPAVELASATPTPAPAQLQLPMRYLRPPTSCSERSNSSPDRTSSPRPRTTFSSDSTSNSPLSTLCSSGFLSSMAAPRPPSPFDLNALPETPPGLADAATSAPAMHPTDAIPSSAMLVDVEAGCGAYYDAPTPSFAARCRSSPVRSTQQAFAGEDWGVVGGSPLPLCVDFSGSHWIHSAFDSE